jgi:hypothetical protein
MSATRARLPNLARPPQLFRDQRRTQRSCVFLKDFKDDPCHMASPRQRVRQQVPDTLGYWAIMRVHPEAVTPGAAGDMDLDDAIECRAVDCRKWIERMVDGVAMHIVEIQ